MAGLTRRRMIRNAAGSAAALAVVGPGGLLQAQAAAVDGKPLPAPAYRLLPLGEVKPAGWLERQLQVQADGLSGHLDEFWPDVGPNSGWLGGTGESWERGPYFLDGLLPMAYLLDDAKLKAKAQKWVDWTLNNQRADGQIGPMPDAGAKNDDWWPRMVMVKVLAQYYEATRDARVLPVLTRYFHFQLATMPGKPLESWGEFRWQDEAYIVQWLYDRTGDAKLLDLVGLLKQQGWDWEAEFVNFRWTQAIARPPKVPKGTRKPGQDDLMLQTHGVNNSQALKAAAVEYRRTGDKAGQQAAFARQVGALDRYHGMPNGMFSCDEHLAGIEPQHGTELCSVVETMFSLEVVLAAFGDARIGDRLEKIAFNCLPGTFTDDMWSHQYNQESNQIHVGMQAQPWTTDGPQSNIYGLQPNFGCCTANFHQGWPKLAASLWMKAPDDGLVAAVYAPSEVRTDVRGTAVHVLEETDYPYSGTVKLTVTPAKTMQFPLSLRVPAWAAGARATLNGKDAGVALTPGTFTRLDRTWKAGDVVEIVFPMETRVSRWFNRSVAVERGPLMFSHDPGEQWTKLHDSGETADWQVDRTAAWNYALAIDESNAGKLEVLETPVGKRPFAQTDVGLRLKVPARRLDAWQPREMVAPAPPASPVQSANAIEMLTLVPYGAAKLRARRFRRCCPSWVQRAVLQEAGCWLAWQFPCSGLNCILAD